MEGFTLVDGVVGFVLLVSALLAYSRGFVREVLSIAGWVIAAVVAFLYAGEVEPLVKEIPVVSDIIGTNCELAMLGAFCIVFIGTLIIVSIFTPLLASMVQNSALGSLDQGLGFMFGAARGVLLVVIALIVYDRVIAGDTGIEMVSESKTVEILSQSQANLEEALPEDTFAWFSVKYAELMAPCGVTPLDEAETPPAAEGDAATQSE